MFGIESLEGKVVWLAGASGGLGGGVAKVLAGEGLSLALHYHEGRVRAEALESELKSDGADVICTSGDLSHRGTAENAVKLLTENLGPPYALVYAAGPYFHKPVLEHSREEFDRIVSGNMTGFFEAAQAVVPHMRGAGEGRIVAFSMTGAHETRPMRNAGPSLAAKAGIVALARTLALETGKAGITVNIISPGRIDDRLATRVQAREKKAGESFPLGVHGSFEDIADAVLFLLSPAASYITGAVLEVTGGWMGDDWRGSQPGFRD